MEQSTPNKGKYTFVLRIAIYLAFATFIFYGLNISGGEIHPPSDIAVATTTPEVVLMSAPTRLVIPTVNIDAKILEVGVTKSGAMDVPHNLTDVGWYKFGAKPGNSGTAVIDGHVDNGWGIAAVFKRLKELNIGDLVYVYDAEGKMSTFKVIETETYLLSESPVQKIFGQTDAAKLNLITCAGNWVQELKTNDKRLVIYTEKVN